jgi:hypothetical protein
MGHSVRFYGVLSFIPLYWLCYQQNNQIAVVIEVAERIKR